MDKPSIPMPAVIRSARILAKLTQAEASAKIYHTLRNWQQWEAGDRKMDPALWELFLLKTGQPVP